MACPGGATIENSTKIIIFKVRIGVISGEGIVGGYWDPSCP